MLRGNSFQRGTKDAVLVGFNPNMGDGAVGVFGWSVGATRSIGVAGESNTGCGVYGISTVDNTIGVVGRSMGGQEVEDDPLENVVNEPDPGDGS